MSDYDLVITNARVVRPGHDEPEQLDVGVKDGVFTAIEPTLDQAAAADVLDAGGKLLFPGVVDVHQLWEIYNELGEDAESESRASAQTG